MRRLIILTFVIFYYTKGLTQNSLLFDKFKFDSSYQIIGLCPYTDDSRQYKSLTFIIKDTIQLNKVRSQITFGQTIAKPETEENSLEMYVVKDKKIIEAYSISPQYDNIYFYLNDSTPIIAEFKLQELLKFANYKNLNYSVKSLKFRSKSEFENFIKINNQNKKFLCYQDNTEENEGKFYVTIHKNDIKSVDSAWNLIKSELKRVTTSDKEFLISYKPNLANLSILTFGINTSKKVYDKFNLTNYPKEKWVTNPIEILAYWTK